MFCALPTSPDSSIRHFPDTPNSPWSQGQQQKRRKAMRCAGRHRGWRSQERYAPRCAVSQVSRLLRILRPDLSSNALRDRLTSFCKGTANYSLLIVPPNYSRAHASQTAQQRPLKRPSEAARDLLRPPPSVFIRVHLWLLPSPRAPARISGRRPLARR
jgi:hypothetical protein